MAKYKIGTVVAGIRGTVGGITFSQNKSGIYMKRWRRGSNPRSSKQTSHRGILSDLASAWRDVTESDKADWAAYAIDPAQAQTDPWGVTYYLSGFHWYVKVNTGLIYVGRATTSTPPTAAAPVAPVISTFAAYATGGAASEITWPNGTFGAGEDCVLFVAIASLYGAESAPANQRLILSKQSPGATGETFQSELEAAFGSISVNQKVWAFLYKQSSEGRRGPVMSAAAVVT